jgi:cytochrome c-type biogenesis protein CcmH/NrfF
VVVRRWLPWGLLLAVVAASLGVAAADEAGPRSNRERVEAIGATIQCPTCRGQAVTDSAAPAATNIRREIARRVEAGESDDQIRAAIADAFGDQVLLNPPRSGFAAVVWVLPVAAFLVAVAGLALAFRRWRTVW